MAKALKKLVKKKKKELTKFRIQVRSRQPSHNWLRENVGLLPFRSVVRLGSTTELPDTVTMGGKRIECNTVQSIKNSSNKRLMKDCFIKSGVKTADWVYAKDINNKDLVKGLGFPIVAKHIYGSRGTGNYLLKTQEELNNWLKGKDLNSYIFEKFYNFAREYRLHVSKNGCFYTNRKLRRKDTPEKDRWFFNDSNSNWILENNPLFDKPVNWDTIVKECVKALDSIGLDIGGFDVKVQSAFDNKDRRRKECDFIIIESNSACSHGDITKQKYLEIIPGILTEKYKKINV